MGLIAKEVGGSSDYTPVPEGTFQAVCNMVVDLGLQNTNFQGKDAVKHQCWIRWELPTERLELTNQSGAVISVPMSIGKLYTLSLHEKATLRKDLEGWRGRAFTAQELQGFDLFKLGGIPCQVSVVHVKRNDRTYANVVGVAGWPKGLDKPKATETGIILYSLDQPEHYPDLPQWLRDKINQRVEEPAAAPPPVAAGDELNDDIPF
jgi:hypothetical protein